MRRVFQYSTFQQLVAAGFVAVLVRSLWPTVRVAMLSLYNELPWHL